MITLLVVDTETGGLNADDACIIEIAARFVTFEGATIKTSHCFEQRIKPDRPVNPGAAKVNGYHPETWGGYPPKDVLENFKQWVEDTPTKGIMWCGCNPNFDLKFVASDFKRHGIPLIDNLSHRVIDVQSMAFPMLMNDVLVGLSLSVLRKWAGCPGDQSHTAAGDVRDTIAVVTRILHG